MKQIFGVSAFGLKDCIAGPNQVCKEEGFFVADAVLPESPLGRILTGTEAENERIHSGLSWPREARIEIGHELRRVPISCAWSCLTEAGDRSVRWKVSGGASFPLEIILAEHINGLLREFDVQETTPHEVVLAIPNHLDEFSQDGLLKALGNSRKQDIRLVWRPVAAALAWLDRVQDSFGGVNDGDWMGVIYVGVDSIEFTALGLREQFHEGKSFVIPVRERPWEDPGPNAADWIADGLEQILGLDQKDIGAFWQVFTNFSEVWAALARRPWDASSLPRAWSRQNGWQGWVPPENLSEKLLKVQVGGSSTISDLFKPSCAQTKLIRRGRGKKWEEYLEDEVKKLLDISGGRHLRGIVLCGPLAPIESMQWFAHLLEKLSAGVIQGTASPRVDSLWLTSNCEDPISVGAQIYGIRLYNNQPTYLDTLPQISTLVIHGGEYLWVNLVDLSECEGGKEYINYVNEKFKISKDYDHVKFYLKKEIRKSDSLDDFIFPNNMNENFVNSIKNKVKNLGSVEAVKYDDNLKKNQNAWRCAIQYAEQLFLHQELNRSPYRLGKVYFPISSPEDTILDLEVKMRPASGQARVEIIPHNNAFLRGRKIFFDYTKMEDIEELPKRTRGWPEIVSIDTDNSPDVFENDSNIRLYFNRNQESSHDYLDLLDNAHREWSKPVASWQDGNQIWLKKINQNGKTGSAASQKIVDKISAKIDIDFIKFKTSSQYDNIKEKIIIRGSWLWLSTPSSIVSYLIEYFEKNRHAYSNSWNYYAESASRCFSNKSSYNILFKSIYDRISERNVKIKFPIQSARSIYRVLMYRPDGQFGLNDQFAHAFLEEAYNIIDKEVRKKKFDRLFFQGILLFLVLLRYRKVNEGFLNPDNNVYKDLFVKIEELLNKAIISIRGGNSHAKDKISFLMIEIQKYMRYEGVPGIIKIVASEAGDS